jgi:hypothetical protein
MLQCSQSLQTFVHLAAFIWLKRRCADEASRPFIQRSTTKGAPLFLIGAVSIKAQLFNRLTRGDTW